MLCWVFHCVWICKDRQWTISFEFNIHLLGHSLGILCHVRVVNRVNVLYLCLKFLLDALLLCFGQSLGTGQFTRAFFRRNISVLSLVFLLLLILPIPLTIKLTRILLWAVSMLIIWDSIGTSANFSWIRRMCSAVIDRQYRCWIRGTLINFSALLLYIVRIYGESLLLRILEDAFSSSNLYFFSVLRHQVR